MKGKRYTTEDKIRILRSADGGDGIRFFEPLGELVGVMS